MRRNQHLLSHPIAIGRPVPLPADCIGVRQQVARSPHCQLRPPAVIKNAWEKKHVPVKTLCVQLTQKRERKKIDATTFKTYLEASSCA